MNFYKIFYAFLFFLIFQDVHSQDTLDMKEVYIENDLVYKYSDNFRFTGVVQLKRKKNEVYFEEVYNDGIILFDYQYFKGSDRKLIYRTDYNRYKPWSKEKAFYYPKSGKWIQITSYDEHGKKILIEKFEKEKLIYSCQYSGKKKNGQEICYDENGNQLIFQYVNGKILRVKK
ncbi:hypothetical protein QSV08_02245 [Maribacter sp. BPC-D8]|uniref:hypothetical protein n=1 Tax=Maribacter sp. BPC-D8 TaxID=3053613 RepID=UPI002B46C59D|nr:hypothetical protein [Maribacter sp. BPC-D8]WRI30062.1 hypothetical protein QSV08_02245 [Maribacter sp. BPC-D8]